MSITLSDCEGGSSVYFKKNACFLSCCSCERVNNISRLPSLNLDFTIEYSPAGKLFAFGFRNFVGS